MQYITSRGYPTDRALRLHLVPLMNTTWQCAVSMVVRGLWRSPIPNRCTSRRNAIIQAYHSSIVLCGRNWIMLHMVVLRVDYFAVDNDALSTPVPNCRAVLRLLNRCPLSGCGDAVLAK